MLHFYRKCFYPATFYRVNGLFKNTFSARAQDNFESSDKILAKALKHNQGAQPGG